MSKINIIKSKIKNNKTVILYRNDFNNLHIAIWDGTDINAYGKKSTLPWNFRQTASYGKNINCEYLNEKYNTICNLLGTIENHQLVK